VMQQVAVDMDTSVSQAAPGPPAAAQPAVLGATGRAPAVAAAAAAVTNDLGGIAEWNLFALAGLPLPQAGGAAGDTDMYMEPAAAQQGRGRLVAQQGPPGAGRGREDDSDMELSYGDAPPQPAVKHPAAAPLPPWRGAEPAAMEQGAAAAGAIGAIGAGGPAAAAGGAVGQAPVGAAGAAAAVAAAGGEQAAPRPARRPKASEVLQALLGATAASPAPQDVTPVFDALAAALGVTLDALTTQQRDGVVLDPAELLRAANAVPAPGRSRPLEVVDFCRAHAGVLMKQVGAGVEEGFRSRGVEGHAAAAAMPCCLHGQASRAGDCGEPCPVTDPSLEQEELAAACCQHSGAGLAAHWQVWLSAGGSRHHDQQLMCHTCLLPSLQPESALCRLCQSPSPPTD
jgi:hypothetical protein